MSNTPTLPDADVQEPIPDDGYDDDDLVGIPTKDDDGTGSDLPEPADDPLPSGGEPGSDAVSNDFA